MHLKESERQDHQSETHEHFNDQLREPLDGQPGNKRVVTDLPEHAPGEGRQLPRQYEASPSLPHQQKVSRWL